MTTGYKDARSRLVAAREDTNNREHEWDSRVLEEQRVDLDAGSQGVADPVDADVHFVRAPSSQSLT